MTERSIKWRVVIVLSVVAVIIAVIFIMRPTELFQSRQFQLGNEIIERVEVYRARTGSLPNTLGEIGYDEETLDVYYQRLDGDEYQVWFGTALGESETYNSREKRWD